jgi:hypothetical protein
LVEVFVTHIQVDQLEEDPRSSEAAIAARDRKGDSIDKDTDRRRRLGPIKVGESRRGGGSGDIKIDDIAGGKAQQYPDGLLIATAAVEADTFVTEETRLPKKIHKYQTRLKIKSFYEFYDLLRSLE